MRLPRWARTRNSSRLGVIMPAALPPFASLSVRKRAASKKSEGVQIIPQVSVASHRRVPQERRNAQEPQKPWWEAIRGTFKNDPAYVEAMRLGREWREAQQPSKPKTGRFDRRRPVLLQNGGVAGSEDGIALLRSFL